MRTTRLVVREAVRTVFNLFVVVSFNFILFRAIYWSIYGSTFLNCIEREVYSEVIEDWGLDKPLWEQFFIYIWNIIHLNFGRSVAISPGDMIIKFVIKGFLNTSILLFVGTFASLVVGVSLGILIGKMKERGFAKVILNGSQIFYSIPAFLGGVGLIFIFAILLRWFPEGNTISAPHPTSTLGYVMDYIWHMTLPVFLIILTTIGFYVHFTREYLLGTFSGDCVRGGHPRKQREDNISLSHNLKNMIPPLIKVTLSNYANLVVGLTVITEIVFNWYGLGKMLFLGVKWNDVFLVEFSFLMIMILSVISNFAITLVYWFLNIHSESEK